MTHLTPEDTGPQVPPLSPECRHPRVTPVAARVARGWPRVARVAARVARGW